MSKPSERQKNPSEPTQEQLDAFIKRAGFSYGWQNLESWARRMAEKAVEELNKATLKNQASVTQDAGDPAREILNNLARRLRMAKQHESRMSGTPVALMAEGARLEAWNSFQAAKALYNDPTVEGAVDTAQPQAQRQPSDTHMRALWAKHAAKYHGWPNDATPPMQDLGNGPRFETGWHESEYTVFRAGYIAAHNELPVAPTKQPEVESGYMLVPTVITKEMEDAFQKGFITQLHKRRNGSAKHPMSAEAAGLHAMLKAVPQPSSQQTTDPTGSTMTTAGKKTIEQKTSEADTAFEDYDFGEDDSVVHHDGWDTSDPKDLIKVVYMQFDGYPSDESEKVSFHVRFDENDNIEEVYALECRHGTEIGSYPKQKPSSNPGMGM
jgi:hypothetical protein